jgi:hypothetical protein
MASAGRRRGVGRCSLFPITRHGPNIPALSQRGFVSCGYQPMMKKVVGDGRASLDDETEVNPAMRRLVEDEFRRGPAFPSCPSRTMGRREKAARGFLSGPSLSNAWLSCAGTGDLAPAVGMLKVSSPNSGD